MTRVAREGDDLHTQQASEQSVSLSTTLADLANETAREAMFLSERKATREDAASREAMTDQHEWESTLGDGID